MKTKFLFIFVLCLITFNKSTSMISLVSAGEVEDVDIEVGSSEFSELSLEYQNTILYRRILDLQAAEGNTDEIVRLETQRDSNIATLVSRRRDTDLQVRDTGQFDPRFIVPVQVPLSLGSTGSLSQINISCADSTNITSKGIDELAEQSEALYCGEERSSNNTSEFCSCVSRSSANSDDGQYSPMNGDTLQLMTDLLVKKVIGDQAVNIRKLSDNIQKKHRWLSLNSQIYGVQSDSLDNLSCVSGGIDSIFQEIADNESNKCDQSGVDFIDNQFDIANTVYEQDSRPGMSFRSRAGDEDESFGEYLDRVGSPQQAYENSGRLTPAYINRDVLYRTARGSQVTRDVFNYGDDVNRLFSEYQSPLSEAQKTQKLDELIAVLNEDENFRKLKRDPFLDSIFQQHTQSCREDCDTEQRKAGLESIVEFISAYATRNPGLNFSDAILGFETDQAAAFEVKECSELKTKFEKLCSDATTKDFKLTDYDIGRNPLGNPSLAQSLIEIGNASESEEETIRNSTDQLMCSLTGNMANIFDESGYTNFYSDPRIQHLLTQFESADDFVAQATSIMSDPERAIQEAADYISSLEDGSIFSDEFGLSDKDLDEIISESNTSSISSAKGTGSTTSGDSNDSSSTSSSSSSSNTSAYVPTTIPTTSIPTAVSSANDESTEESIGVNEEEVAKKNEEQMSRLKAEIEELRKNLALIEKSKESGGPGDSIVSSSSQAEINALRAELEDKEKRLKELEEKQLANDETSQGENGQDSSTTATSSGVSTSTPKSSTTSSGLTGSGSRSSSRSSSSSVPSSSNTSSSGYSDFTESGIIQEQNNPYSAFYIRELPDGVMLSGGLLSDSQIASQIENNEVQVITLEKFREFRNSPQTIRLISNAEGGELFVLDQENNRLIKVEVNQANEFCLSSSEISECTEVANIEQGKISDERSPASNETEQQGPRVRLKGLKGLLDKSINN